MAGMADEQATRPGTRALRLALVGIPVGALLIAISLAFGVDAEGVAYAVFEVLGWIGTVLLLAGIGGLGVGLWKRLA